MHPTSLAQRLAFEKGLREGIVSLQQSQGTVGLFKCQSVELGKASVGLIVE